MKVLGYDYPIRDTTMKETGRCGRFVFDDGVVEIASDMGQQQRESAALHEMLHAIDYHLAIELDEDQIRRLETGLFQSLTANGINLERLLEVLE